MLVVSSGCEMTCSSLSSDGKSSGSSGYSCSGFLIVVILYVLTTAVSPFLSSCSDCSVSLSDKTYSINSVASLHVFMSILGAFFFS